nr:ATP-binding protein [Tessaracoccus sp. MC1679]
MLTSKARLCRSRGINFTCVADGTALGFIEVIDLASILGNALDNAIESVSRLEDPEHRIIRVAVFNQARFVVMKFENYFDGELRYLEGELATRKIGGTHGLGLKSIRFTAEKYGGQATVADKDNWFTLTVLLPLS